MKWITSLQIEWRKKWRLLYSRHFNKLGKPASLVFRLDGHDLGLQLEEMKSSAQLQQQLVDALISYGVLPVRILAGNQLDHPSIPHLIRLASRLDCSVTLVGNGPQITEDTALSFIRCGLSRFEFDVASTNSEKQSELIGQSLEVVLSNLNQLQSAAIKWEVPFKTVARLPWYDETSTQAKSICDLLFQKDIDELMISVPFIAANLSSNKANLMEIYHGYEKVNCSTEILNAVDISRRVPLPGIPNQGEPCRVSGDRVVFRVDGTKYTCPFFPSTSWDGSLKEHHKKTRLCNRHCVHPDLFPVSP